MEAIHFEGILRIREIPPEWTDAEFRYWWCDERTESGMLIHRARMSEREKDRWTVVEARNLLMSAGRTQLLTFAGASGTTVAFAQFYAVGTGSIFTVQPADTSLATELFRLAPASFSVVGNSVTITTNFSTSQGNGTYTNAGLFGNGATSTPGSGTLMTHILYNYTKTSANAIANDYLISLT